MIGKKKFHVKGFFNLFPHFDANIPALNYSIIPSGSTRKWS